MENIILESMLNEYKKKHKIEESDSRIFETFSSYCLYSNQYYDSYDADQIGTGECVGIDAVAISINDILVFSEESAKNHTHGQFDVCFNFMQAKTSSKLDLGDYLKFLQTILIFFTKAEGDQPEELKEAFKIKKHIYEKASRFRLYPSIEISYVYTGAGIIESKDFRTQVDSVLTQIKSLPYLFSDVKSTLIGAQGLSDRYKAALSRTTKHLVFQRHLPLPKLSAATAAYLGVAKCKDYIDFLKGEDGQINKGAFYDNVRDYLGSNNKVNSDIEDTIKSDSQRSLFSVLNNGVTIVAKKVVPSGDSCEISAFQVVNGCQTSHVLFNNRAHVTDDMYLTIKLIETDDIDLSSSVINATNNQSLVMKEAFATIKPYHKHLEDFFKAMNARGYRIFYERRPHQFDDNDDILNNEIASAPLLIKSFVSVVLGEPHKVHFYYGQILRDYNKEKTTLVFDENHHPGLYFISHMIYSRAKIFCVRNKMGLWSYHFSYLVAKKIGIRLHPNERLSDVRISSIISQVEKDFVSAANAVLRIFPIASLRKNDVMLSEKTAELQKLFVTKFSQNSTANSNPIPQIETGNAKQEKKNSAAVIKKFFRDGLYVFKNIEKQTEGIAFDYGASRYFLPYDMKSVSQGKIAQAQVKIANGRVCEIRI